MNILKFVMYVCMNLVGSVALLNAQEVVKAVCGDCHWECELEIKGDLGWRFLKKVNIGTKQKDCSNFSPRQYGQNSQYDDYEYRWKPSQAPQFICNCSPEQNETIKTKLNEGHSMNDLTFADGGSIKVKSDQDRAAEKKFEVAGSYRMSCKNCSLNYVEGWLAAGYALSCECWDKNSKSWKKALIGLDINKKVFNCESNQIRNNNGNLECCPMGVCRRRVDEEITVDEPCVKCD